jgi:hypothetical protein
MEANIGIHKQQIEYVYICCVLHIHKHVLWKSQIWYRVVDQPRLIKFQNVWSSSEGNTQTNNQMYISTTAPLRHKVECPNTLACLSGLLWIASWVPANLLATALAWTALLSVSHLFLTAFEAPHGHRKVTQVFREHSKLRTTQDLRKTL